MGRLVVGVLVDRDDRVLDVRARFLFAVFEANGTNVFFTGLVRFNREHSAAAASAATAHAAADRLVAAAHAAASAAAAHAAASVTSAVHAFAEHSAAKPAAGTAAHTAHGAKPAAAEAARLRKYGNAGKRGGHFDDDRLVGLIRDRDAALEGAFRGQLNLDKPLVDRLEQLDRLRLVGGVFLRVVRRVRANAS